jgi:hypothetical protein
LQFHGRLANASAVRLTENQTRIAKRWSARPVSKLRNDQPLSLRKIAADLAKRGCVTPSDRPYSASARFDAPRQVAALSVWFPESKLDALSTPAELVEHHTGCASMHGIVPIESTDRIVRAILVVDTNIINPDAVFILAPIFGHGRISRTIDSGVSPGDASAVMRRVQIPASC